MLPWLRCYLGIAQTLLTLSTDNLHLFVHSDRWKLRQPEKPFRPVSSVTLLLRPILGSTVDIAAPLNLLSSVIVQTNAQTGLPIRAIEKYAEVRKQNLHFLVGQIKLIHPGTAGFSGTLTISIFKPIAKIWKQHQGIHNQTNLNYQRSQL